MNSKNTIFHNPRNTYNHLKALERALDKSCPKDLNIFNVLNFELNEQNLTKDSDTPKGKEIIVFPLSGMLEGAVTCPLDTTANESQRSIQKEAFNILIGHILTNLDNNFDIRSQISSPTDIEFIDTGLDLSQHQEIQYLYDVAFENKIQKIPLTFLIKTTNL